MMPASMLNKGQRVIDMNPKLSSLGVSCYRWESAITTYLQFDDCLNATHGLNTEPYRVTTAVADRAGPIAPEGPASTTTNRVLTVEEREGCRTLG